MKRPELSDLMTSLKSLSPLPDLDLDLLRSAVKPRLSRTRTVMTGEVIITEDALHGDHDPDHTRHSGVWSLKLDLELVTTLTLNCQHAPREQSCHRSSIIFQYKK